MWRVHTCVLAENAGIPAVTIGTAEYFETGRQIAGAQGLPQLPMVMVPHPLSALSEDEVWAIADRILPEIISALTVR